MGLRRDNPLGMLVEHSRSLCTSFSRVLPTFRVGYHDVKPIKSVVYCLIISYFLRLTSFRPAAGFKAVSDLLNKPEISEDGGAKRPAKPRRNF